MTIDIARRDWLKGEHDFVVDDARFRERFHFGATDLDEALRATANWAIRTFAKGVKAKPAERSSHA